MKNLALITFIFCLSACQSTPEINNSQENQQIENQIVEIKALDKSIWQGLYQGIIPCAQNCQSTIVSLYLGEDESYTLRTRTIPQEDEDNKIEGKFAWLAQDILQLDNKNYIYKVENKRLLMLNEQKEALPEIYALKKVEDYEQ